MGKIFEVTLASRKAIDKAMARLDAKKARQRKAATVKAMAVKQKRQREKAEARRPSFLPDARSQPNALRRRYELPGWKVLVARMEPGSWYDWPQIQQLMAEFGRGSVKAWLWQKAMGAGLIERAGNPDFKPSINNPAEQGSRYLYAIAPSATQARAEWRIALGMAG